MLFAQLMQLYRIGQVKKLRWYQLFPLFISITIVTALIVDFSSWNSPQGFRLAYLIDLDVYRKGGQALLSGENLYGQDYVVGDPRHSGSITLPFTYPPFAAALFAAFAWLPYGLNSLLLALASLALLFCILYLFVRSAAPEKSTGATLTWACWFLVAACLTEPVTQTINFGQINIILVALVVIDILAVPSTSRWRGVLTGIAVAIKLTPAVFLGYFFIRRQWRAMATTLVSFVACAALGFLFSASSSLQYWTETLRNSERIGGLAYASNQSLRGFFSRVAPEHASAAWLITCLIVVAALWWIMHRVSQSGLTQPARPEAPNSTVGDVELLLLASAAALLCSPVSWSHHFIWLTLAAAFLTVRRCYWAAALSWLVLFARGHWLVPSTNDQELTWSLWQQVPGNDYLWLTCALIALAAASSFSGSSTRETADNAQPKAVA